MQKFTIPGEALNYLKRDDRPFPKLTENITFNCAEQYMMHAKAVYFNDEESALQILKCSSPRTQKALGRAVKNWDEEEWEKIRERVVDTANWIKFKDKDLRELLLATGNRTLVEASPLDRVWGIGFTARDASNMESDSECFGLNLLGKGLMRVRAKIRESLGETTR
jgi:ribA/ribD-fused uncharacterized protein